MEAKILEQICMTVPELNEIGEMIGIKLAGTRLDNGEIGVDDILRVTVGYIKKKEETITKCLETIEELTKENEKLKERVSTSAKLSEVTMDRLQKLRKDFNMKSGLATGRLSIDGIMNELLDANEKHSIEPFCKMTLMGINFPLKGDDCYEAIVPKLVEMIKAKDIKIGKLENNNQYMEYRLKAGQEACKLVEKAYPGILGIVDEQLVVEKGYALFDNVIDCLLAKCSELEAKVRSMRVRNNSKMASENNMEVQYEEGTIEYQIKELIEDGYTKTEISEKLGLERSKLYRIMKKMGAV